MAGREGKAQWFLAETTPMPKPWWGEYVLDTSLLDKTIGKHEIQELYLTRWDIEVGIGEIKTVMAINILRSQTPEMALKELTVWLSAYHLIRKMI